MNKMNPVVHFEIPADDPDRMSDFYSQAFGWRMEKMGPEMGNYIVVSTSEPGEGGRPKEIGMINGGFFKRTKDNRHPSVVIAVEDIRAAMDKIRAAGGRVIGGSGGGPGEPDDIPGVGLYASFEDTEGNILSVLQPSMDGGSDA